MTPRHGRRGAMNLRPLASRTRRTAIRPLRRRLPACQKCQLLTELSRAYRTGGEVWIWPGFCHPCDFRANHYPWPKRCRDFGVAKIGISGAVFVTAGKCPLPPISALRDVCACNPLISLDGGGPAIGVTGSNSTQRGSNPLSPASHRGLFIGPALREVSTFPAVRAREPGLLRRKSGTPHRRPRFSGRVSAR
jgi:hypothetical protein